jgi:hypothetical protein
MASRETRGCSCMLQAMRANALLVCLLGCSESGANLDPAACELQISLTGAVTATFSMLDCQAAVDLGGDPIIAFFPDHPSIMRIDLQPPATSGPGDLDIISPSGFVWSANDCAYDIARFESPRAAGSATCPPAAPEAGTGTVVIGTFAFDTF